MYDAVADDYCYPDTTVLRNRLDLRDAAELADFEAEVSDARADEEAPAGDLDFKHFKAALRRRKDKRSNSIRLAAIGLYRLIARRSRTRPLRQGWRDGSGCAATRRFW